jgi:hypothetical protein
VVEKFFDSVSPDRRLTHSRNFFLMDVKFDLFGDPVPDNFGKRGRPAHIPTSGNTNKVKMLVSLGWGNERIARAMGITPPSLRKHYFSVLKYRDEMRDRLDARYALKVWEQVEQGNVGAMRLWQQFIDRNDAAVGHNSFYSEQRREEQDAPKDSPVGKKARQVLDAQTAGENTEWGNDLVPRPN